MLDQMSAEAWLRLKRLRFEGENMCAKERLGEEGWDNTRGIGRSLATSLERCPRASNAPCVVRVRIRTHCALSSL